MATKSLDLKSIGILIGILVMVGGWVWNVARMPTASDFKEVKDRVEKKEEHVKEEIEDIRKEQSAIKADVTIIKNSQERSEKVQERILDQLLRPSRGRRSHNTR